MTGSKSIILAGIAILFGIQINAAPVTFNRDVAPILFHHCASCHNPGGIGPFSLLTYPDARRHATQIAHVTKRRYMPPWPPEPGHGEFRDNPRLSEAQIETLAAWAEHGAPQGPTSDLPSPPVFNNSWRTGTPDLILEMPEPFTMTPGGKDLFRNFVIPTNLKDIRYVRGVEMRFNNTRPVHHANIVLDRTGALRKRDGEDGHPGFGGMDVVTEAAPNDFDPDSHFLFWKPGTVLHPEPADMSWKLDPGTDLIVNLHLQPTGKPESIRAQIGLYFSPEPPKRFPMLVQLEHDGAIDIPPGDPAFVVTDRLTIPVDCDALAIYPHAHYLGKVIEAWAMLPNGTRRPLIRIPDWDINWQAVYEYAHPVFLPKGSVVHMRIAYDNSTANPRNPNSPPKRVRSGDRSEDEMGHVWLQVLPRQSTPGENDGRILIQEALMRRRLEKYPADFLAHYNLGAVEQLRGHLDQAVLEYRHALQQEPPNPGARNSLASALLLQDQTSAAIDELRRVLKSDPSYLNARYNLAHALAIAGDLDGSALEYATFLKARPNDADAQAGLGSVYFLLHRFPDALPCFEKAAQLDPRNADVQANFGTVLAISGDLRGAVAAYRNALKIKPDHQAARANLAKAEAQLQAAQ
jgi:Flp pilus assembly protein TadD/mono/diheme cytochrome c family protein